jgi:hypothetical protein
MKLELEILGFATSELRQILGFLAALKNLIVYQVW